jgi:hypothetical protein
MTKNTTISLRVCGEQLQKIRELNLNYVDCWELGYERICENERSELEKLDKKYHDLYIHYHTKLETFGRQPDTINKELDRLLEWYNKGNRNINNPSNTDLETLKLQMKKRGIRSFNVDQVIDYFRRNNHPE